MPAGFAPAQNGIYQQQAGSSTSIAYISILANGAVQPAFTGGSPVMYLDGIVFLNN